MDKGNRSGGDCTPAIPENNIKKKTQSITSMKKTVLHIVLNFILLSCRNNQDNKFQKNAN
jgi:hypothetical protein